MGACFDQLRLGPYTVLLILGNYVSGQACTSSLKTSSLVSTADIRARPIRVGCEVLLGDIR